MQRLCGLDLNVEFCGGRFGRFGGLCIGVACAVMCLCGVLRISVCVCVCIYVCACMCICVYVCFW